MKRKVTIFFCCMSLVNLLFAQNTNLSLEECHQEMLQNYPLQKGQAILQQKNVLSVERIRTSYFPQLYANGKVSYQSDVTGISVPNMQMPTAPKDQYAIHVDVEQLLFDGGRIKSRIQQENLSSQMEELGIDVQMHQLKERVNQAYFSILLLRKSRLILEEKRKLLHAKLKEISIAVQNGVLLPANQKVIEVELLIIDQQEEELKESEKTAFETLSQLMGREIDPAIDLQDKQSISNHLLTKKTKERPEYAWYDSQKSLLDEQIHFAQRDRMPVLTAFGQMGYGNPGYNQLTDEFDSYYMLGMKLSWKIWDWKASKKEQKKLHLQKSLIDTQLESFEKQQNMELEEEMNQINRLKLQIQKDHLIVDLYGDIVKSSESQLKNGLIPSSDYLEDVNKQVQAQLNKAYHQIQLQLAYAEYERIMGKNTH